MNNKVNFQLHHGDEVATIHNGKLVFGTVLQQENVRKGDSSSSTEKCQVSWISDPNDIPSKLITKEQVTLTDRAIVKGCKVRHVERNKEMIAVVRNVIVTADLRIVGTNTYITAPINRFTPLKGYKQRSVVYYDGWLGVIVDTSRTATIRYLDGSRAITSLTDLQLAGPLIQEPPFINELIDYSSFSIRNIKHLTDGTVASGENTAPQVTTTVTNTRTMFSKDGTVPFDPMTPHVVFVEDTHVESITVNWCYQVGLMYPERPVSFYKADKLKNLQIVKEEQSSESDYSVGNLGRFQLRTDDELSNYTRWSKKTAAKLMPPEVAGLLAKDYAAVASSRAYDPNPEAKLKDYSENCVVEIARLSSVADIMWQDGSMDICPSIEVTVVPESLLDRVLMVGDYVYSKVMGKAWKEVYGVLQPSTESKMSVVRIFNCFDTTSTTMTIPEKLLRPHPRYSALNETNTIVVLNTADSLTRIGNVIGNNLFGKVSIHFIDSGKDEWWKPSDLSIFTSSGFDLDMIYCNIIDESGLDRELSTREKFEREMQTLKDVEDIWKEEGSSRRSRDKGLTDLMSFISKFQKLERKYGQVGNYLLSENN